MIDTLFLNGQKRSRSKYFLGISNLRASPLSTCHSVLEWLAIQIDCFDILYLELSHSCAKDSFSSQTVAPLRTNTFLIARLFYKLHNLVAIKWYLPVWQNCHKAVHQKNCFYFENCICISFYWFPFNDFKPSLFVIKISICVFFSFLCDSTQKFMHKFMTKFLCITIKNKKNTKKEFQGRFFHVLTKRRVVVTAVVLHRIRNWKDQKRETKTLINRNC